MAAFVPQGTLNRLSSSVIVPSFLFLNITAPYMGKSFVKISFEGQFGELINTATGGVTSPEPYVMATVTVSVLKTQALGAAWMAAGLLNCNIGPITVTPDSSAYPALTFQNCILANQDIGAYDGTDPVVRLTIKGIFYVNSELWAAA